MAGPAQAQSYFDFLRPVQPTPSQVTAPGSGPVLDPIYAEILLRASWRLAPGHATPISTKAAWNQLLAAIPASDPKINLQQKFSPQIDAFFNAASYGQRLWIADHLRYQLALESGNKLPSTDGELIQALVPIWEKLSKTTLWPPLGRQMIYTSWHGLIAPYCAPTHPARVKIAQPWVEAWTQEPSPKSPDGSVALKQTKILIQERFSQKSMRTALAALFAREGIESSVVLFAILALATAHAGPGARRRVILGAITGIALSILLFWAVQFPLQAAFSAFRWVALISVTISAILLFVVSGWIWHKFYWTGWLKLLRRLDASAQGVGSSKIWFVLGLVAVLREGIELALISQIILQGQSSMAAAWGIGMGLAIAALCAALVLSAQRWLPLRRLLEWSAVLVALLVTIFAGYGVRLLQVTQWLPVTEIERWSEHWPTWIGLWLGIFPTREGLLAQGLALGYVVLAATPFLWQLMREKLSRENAAPS